VRAATPATERPLRVLTWLADEKLLLAAVAAFWVNARLRPDNESIRREADRMLIGVAIAGVVPHLFKHLVNRKRPDRTLVHGPRHGIPRSGDAWDSFPSGHAVHIGALAAPLLRVSPSPMRPLVGAGLAGLAATRILLLAHYVSDVLAGLVVGAGISVMVTHLTRRAEAAAFRPSPAEATPKDAYGHQSPRMTDTTATPAFIAHGARRLPSVEVEAYNLELEDDEGFIGDRASHKAFRELLEEWRKALRKTDEDPFGDKASEDISKRKLDATLTEGDGEAAGIVQGAIEDFAQEFAGVIRKFLKVKAWRDAERIAVGGGFRDSRIGELAIGRTSVILKADKIAIDLVALHNDPDDAALIGSGHLAPRWMFHGHDAILAVDIGGSSIRAGVVKLQLQKASDLSKANVWKMDEWHHVSEPKTPKREDAVDRIVDMLEDMIARAKKEDIALAPFIGVGCPGAIAADGTIERGSQNLPGKWDSKSFNLPAILAERIPKIGKFETAVVMHNDAVVQGLSELPYMTDVQRWGAFTVGTGLGNALFANRSEKKET
jgi:membrane-associated phospholipid phosphatase